MTNSNTTSSTSIANLKSLSKTGGPVLVVSAFCASNFKNAPLGIAFEVTHELLEELTRISQMASSQPDIGRLSHSVSIDYSYLYQAGRDEQEDVPYTCEWIVLSHGGVLYLQEQDEYDAPITSRFITVDLLKDVLTGDYSLLSANFFIDDTCGVFFYSDYHGEAKETFKQLNANGVEIV